MRIQEHIIREAASDDAFMGRTHALSATALILSCFAFIHGAASWLPKDRASALAFLAFITLIAAGGALLPDLDNTKSTALTQLGVAGEIISLIMRATAPLIKGAIHTKYDNNLDNPHRSFYHTTIAAILCGGLTALLCSPLISWNLGFYTITGRENAIFLAFVSIDLALSSIVGAIWANKKPAIVAVSLLCSFAIAFGLTLVLPKNVPYTIVGLMLGIGWFIHCLGDCFTTAGTPLFWPIPIKGKMWYNIRFLPIKAGGVIENFFFMPLFIIITIIAAITLILTV